VTESAAGALIKWRWFDTLAIQPLPVGLRRREHMTVDRPADLAKAVREVAAGDEAAFRAVYRAVQSALLRHLGILVGEHAEDVASETWLQIARDVGRYRGEGGGCRRWAATIARHRALDHLRHHQRRPSLPAATHHFAGLAGFDDTESRAIDAVGMPATIDWIASMPQDQAQAIMLRVVGGLDAQTAAAVLGKRAGAVRSGHDAPRPATPHRLAQASTPAFPCELAGEDAAAIAFRVAAGTNPAPSIEEGQ
jgi:RNA polymerase sigma-70 factor, ECF subfamily